MKDKEKVTANSIKYFWLLALLLVLPINLQAGAYVTESTSSVLFEVSKELSPLPLQLGTMLEPDSPLKFSNNTLLSVYCGKTNSIIKVSSADDLNNRCFQNYKKPDSMRASGNQLAPVIMFPRQALVFDIKTVICRSDVPGEYTLIIISLNENNKEIIHEKIVDPESTKMVVTTFRYSLPNSLRKELKAGNTYQLIIKNTTNNETSATDHEYPGVFTVVGKDLQEKIISERKRINPEEDLLKPFLEAMYLKNEGFYQESIDVLEGLVDRKNFSNSRLNLLSDAQFQIAENYYFLKSKPDFTAIQYLKALQSAAQEGDKLAGFGACQRLLDLYLSLNRTWKQQFKLQLDKPEIREVCPLYSG